MLLVIVNNLHVRWSRCLLSPLEADPPLIVNADAVLAFAIANQRFKTIAGQSDKVLKGRGRLQTVKLQARGAFKSRECLDPFSGGEVSGPLVPIAHYHRLRLPGITRYVKHNEIFAGEPMTATDHNPSEYP